MTIYTTPLQFGYFFSIVMALLFWRRSFQEERLSDRLLGWVMLFIAIQLQDYTFGFAGINVLWEELNGFPRGVDLLFGPAVYFYLKSQTNRTFHFEKKHWLHLLPWLVYFVVDASIFAAGEEAVETYQQSSIIEVLSVVHYLARITSLSYYLWGSIKIYKAYRIWSEGQFSDTETISFRWFRNFLYFMVVWIICREMMFVIDEFVDLSFYQDWWWNLPLVVTAFYVGLQGHSQPQPQSIWFSLQNKAEALKTEPFAKEARSSKTDWNKKIDEQQLYLQSDLSLNELARYLGANARELSNYINENFGVNFNDYINQKRVLAFEQKIANGEQDKLTLLSLAYDSGFNSKATFHRAFKKHKGITPKEFVQARHSRS